MKREGQGADRGGERTREEGKGVEGTYRIFRRIAYAIIGQS